MKNQWDVKGILEKRQNLRYILVGEAALVGLAAGLVAVAYRFAMAWSFNLHAYILDAADDRTGLVFAFFGFLLVLALAVSVLMKWEPFITGSGIPQVEGELKGYFDMPWWRVIVGKLAGSLLCIIGGLSLGREGPSVQLGAMSGKGYSRVMGRGNMEERYLITCGASAGLAAAFNCPLAGVMFALEEVHKSYSVIILFSAMTAAVVADFVSKLFFGMSPVFHIPVTQALPLKDYWILLLFGIIIGLAGAFFNKSMAVTGKVYDRLTFIAPRFRPMIPFLVAGALGFVLPQVLGDGHLMLDALSAGEVGFQMVCLLLVVKFLFSMMSFGSGAPGGSLAPMLVIGAYIGGFCGQLAVIGLGMDPGLVNNFIILAMAGFFTAVVRAPLTAIVLASELTGSFSHMISLALVVIAAEITIQFMGSEPLYDALLKKILAKNAPEDIQEEEGSDEKTIIVRTVGSGSVLDGSAISEIPWPESSLVVGIIREDHEFIPNGSTVVQARDRLTLIADADHFREVKGALIRLCEERLNADE